MWGKKRVKYGFIIVIISILLGTAFFAANGIYLSTSDREYQSIENMNQYAKKQFSNTLIYNMTLLNLLGNDYISKDVNLDNKKIQTEMGTFIHETGMTLYMVDEYGIGYDYKGELIDFNHYVNVGELFSKREGVIQAENNSDLGGAGVYLYTKITNDNSQNYLLIGWYSEDNLNDVYDIDIHDDWNYSYIVDQDGDLVLPLEEPSEYVNLFDFVNDNKGLKDSMEKGESGSKIYLCGSEENVICFNQLNKINGWYIVSIVPQKYINQKANCIIFKIFILCGCFCICMIIVIYYIIKIIKNNTVLIIKNEANACRSRFWSQMSHEIRTPMNAIVGLAEIAKYSIDDRDKLEECLFNIENTSEYLLAVVNDILDVSKIESNKIELNIEPFKISEVIDTVKTVISSNINLKQIKMSIIKSGNMDQIVCGDQKRLKQILVNLIANAAKFTEINGKIRFRIKTETLSDNKVKYLFEVTDSGIGIKKENLEKIFEPFEQGDNNVSSIYGGSGLGLTICKGYLKLMDGKITVDSEYGKRTSFYVEVDFSLANEVEKQIYTDRIKSAQSNSNVSIISMTPIAPVDNSTSDNKKTILLADDNAMNLEVMTTMLEFYGYKVVTAHNGQEAIDIFDNSSMFQFDAILMDVQMPIKNGLEASVEIRSLNRMDASKVKIIALTANAFKEDRLLAEKAGMNMHISKPIKMNVLKDKLDELFSEN
ncbi:ATP-binding protein [[Clostridium] fimetarium]|uniref:Circadian input-output histidine kinase CikA n=1 Tax=[Clostridium] fimetarium TaxID=99656 RepID=A0A1I0MWK1_9FIRM|nr:ATP-binding protein [[Clostridium] fimetarium]SEV93115.1 His Kinase A (phospho-acceptor) domain-containing protein [[Clostridium] fimetarium]